MPREECPVMGRAVPGAGFTDDRPGHDPTNQRRYNPVMVHFWESRPLQVDCTTLSVPPWMPRHFPLFRLLRYQ